jgi:hypothetical protein
VSCSEASEVLFNVSCISVWSKALGKVFKFAVVVFVGVKESAVAVI